LTGPGAAPQALRRSPSSRPQTRRGGGRPALWAGVGVTLVVTAVTAVVLGAAFPTGSLAQRLAHGLAVTSTVAGHPEQAREDAATTSDSSRVVPASAAPHPTRSLLAAFATPRPAHAGPARTAHPAASPGASAGGRP
ncbi:MAG: hypothetical protein ACTHJL_09685, partial [Amnibacterium sp.]